MAASWTHTHHVYPTFGREHATRGSDCWCRPHAFTLCTQCDPDDIDDREDCWACDEGLIEIALHGPMIPDVIVHNLGSPTREKL